MRRRRFLAASALLPVLEVTPASASSDPIVVEAAVPAGTAIALTVRQHETIARENEVYSQTLDVGDGTHGYHVPLAPGYVTSIDVALETEVLTRTPHLHRITVAVPDTDRVRGSEWGLYGGLLAVVGGAFLSMRTGEEEEENAAVSGDAESADPA